jgi:hypothetical protein
MTATVQVAQDPTMPEGRCMVLIDGDIVYAGRLGMPAVSFLLKEGAVLILNPVDFADGQAFMRRFN